MGLHNLTLEKAKSELKTKMNEYQMLNKKDYYIYHKTKKKPKKRENCGNILFKA